MPSYKYVGTDQQGKVVKGVAHSGSTNLLYKQLRSEGIYVRRATALPEKKVELYRLKPKELADFCRQLGVMQRTGIPVIKALGLMLEQNPKHRLRAVYRKIFTMISQGNPLSYAMEQCGGSFPTLMINMFRAGEASGKLDETAMKLAAYYTSEHKLNTKIRNAMAYPILLAILTLLITLVMFTLILPNFFDLFTTNGIELNILTRTVIAISELIVNQWSLLLCGAIFIIIMIRFAVALPATRLQLDRTKLDIPKIGNLVRIVYTARFARTLSSLYSSGISMIEAVEIGVRTIGNSYIENQFVAVLDKIRSGQSLSTAIKGVDGFEKKLTTTIFIGEESGRLDDMLLTMSDEYEFESDMAVERMLTYIEPIMIVVMALIVGVIMVAVMVPVMNMRNTIV